MNSKNWKYGRIWGAGFKFNYIGLGNLNLEPNLTTAHVSLKIVRVLAIVSQNSFLTCARCFMVELYQGVHLLATAGPIFHHAIHTTN